MTWVDLTYARERYLKELDELKGEEEGRRRASSEIVKLVEFVELADEIDDDDLA